MSETPEQIARELALKHGLSYQDDDGFFTDEPNPAAVAAILDALSYQRKEDAKKCDDILADYGIPADSSIRKEVRAIRGKGKDNGD